MWSQRIFHLVDRVRRSISSRGVRHRSAWSENLTPHALRQLDRLEIRGSKYLRGGRVGARGGYRRKPDLEFIEHRMYVPGDDIRFVDWRASARHENFFIRQGQMPKDVVVHLLIDTSASMLWGKQPKRDAQLSLAAALGYAALRNGDRLYVYPYGGRPNPEFGTVSGKGQMNGFLHYLNQLVYGGESNLGSEVRTFVEHAAGGGVVFLLSDLLERGDLNRILSFMPAPRWWVDVLHLLHPIELHPDVRGAFELEDSETGQLVNYDLTSEAIRRYHERMITWREQLELAAVQNHATYVLLNTNWSLDNELLPYLHERKVLVRP